jgi:hypothetical protein
LFAAFSPSRFQYGDTPAHDAAAHGQLTALQTLLTETGYDVNTRNEVCPRCFASIP